jgi:MraZ protein
VDDKGRLKLPVPFQQFLGALPEKRLFATSLDRRTARIYPISSWRETENSWAGLKDSLAKAAKTAKFNARDLGADSEMDGQGRVLLPPELRRALAIENQSVRIYAEKGHIEILSEAQYEEQRRAAEEAAAASVETLELAGLL